MTPDDRWPDPEPDQVRVALLGTYHMDSPGLNAVEIDVDDVLAPERQSELRELVGDLAGWDPDRVAVERPHDRADEVNARYAEYRTGERAYDREERFDPPHPLRDEPDTECRSEVVQVGFRLADRLGHERVYPVDAPTTLGNDEFDRLRERGFEPEEKVPVSLPDEGEIERRESERLAASTIPEFLRWQNREPQLTANHEVLFGEYLRWGEGDNFGGPRMVATWYDRNLRMVHNVWRALEPGDERVLLLVGASHVRVLRHLFGEMPQCCPVSALSVL